MDQLPFEVRLWLFFLTLIAASYLWWRWEKRDEVESAANLRTMQFGREKIVLGLLLVPVGLLTFFVYQQQLTLEHLILVAMSTAIIHPVNYYWKRSRYVAKGIRGEQKVAKRLRVLEERGWSFTFNAQEYGGGDIDIVAVSPQGKWFVIDVKTSSRCYVEENVRSVAGQVIRVRKARDLNWVTGIVCFSEGWKRGRKPFKHQRKLIWVVSEYDLVRQLEVLAEPRWRQRACYR
jgi:Holliday junction resolvase-like predicted endonuclease